MRSWIAVVIVFVGMHSLSLAGEGAPDFGDAVRKFSAARPKLDQELSSRLNLPMPYEALAFFRVAITGNWESVSNRFQKVARRGENGGTIPELRSELWAPVHETLGIWEVWAGWKEDSSLLALFYEPVFKAMPKGSIYFGGTDSGRFVITTINAMKDPPPLFCITQNALADNTYAAHLRAIYGDEIWLPTTEDCNGAFQQYVAEVRSGKLAASADIAIKDGRVQITGVMGVMKINGIICRMIFEHNKDKHPFFVEESYVIDWMYPYLEPCGSIMKLNPQPSEKLTEPVVARDRDFWKGYVELLEGRPGFAANIEARKSFSKLRSAIAGLYAYRKMYGESEAAFRQAIRLYPASPEASFRLAKMFEEQGRLEKATEVMTAYLKCDLSDSRDKAEDYLNQLKKNIGAKE